MLNHLCLAVIGNKVVILVVPAERPRRHLVNCSVFALDLDYFLFGVKVRFPFAVFKSDLFFTCNCVVERVNVVVDFFVDVLYTVRNVNLSLELFALVFTDKPLELFYKRKALFVRDEF